jgi:formylglycine-generating enzyme required for sulfatase activity
LSDPQIANPTFTPDRPGIYVLTLVANDGTDACDPDRLRIEVGMPVLSLARQADGRLLLSWVGQGFMLQSAFSVTGPWGNHVGQTSPLLVDPRASGVPMRFYRLVPAELLWIRPGTFTMGSPATEAERLPDQGPLTAVRISRGFWMGKYEVTQREYLSVIGANPSSFVGDLSRPVERVNWLDATNYCARLTARDRQAERLPAGYAYRLPTEAEWEYACRARTTTAFHYGPALRSGMANFNGRYEYAAAAGTLANPAGTFLARTTSVGQYAPNAWGLHDLHGNVWEWCLDWYGPGLPGGSVIDPIGPGSGTTRVLRGGGWSNYAVHCRSAYRTGLDPAYRNGSAVGFRVVLAPAPP